MDWKTGKWTSTPRDLGEVKKRLVREAKQRAFSLLAPSDWRAIKEAETDEPIAEDWMEYRGAVRDRCNEIEEAVEKAADLAALKALDTSSWPESPDANAAREEGEGE